MPDAIYQPLDTTSPLSKPVNADAISRTLDQANPDNSLEAITKGVPLVASSAATQLWNGVGTLANIAIPFADPFKTDVRGDALVYGDSATRYYDAHRGGIDFAGTVVGSFIPSTLGLKALKAAQTAGRVSEDLAGSVGLLTNQAEAYYLNRAVDAVSRGANPRAFSLAAGAAGGVKFGLQAVAAETATFAALNQSPIYDGVEDVGDFVSNIALVGGVFGGLGGAYKMLRAPGTTFFSEALGRNTTLEEVKNLSSQARQSAAHFEVSKPLAGTTFADTSNILGKDIKMLEGEAAAHVKAKEVGTNIPAVDVYKAQHGDDVSLAYRTGREEDLTKLNPYKEGTAQYDSFAARLKADADARVVAMNANKFNAVSRFTPQEDLRKHVLSSLDNLTPASRDAVLANATKMEWATVAGTKNPGISFVDLKTGEIANSAQVLAHDMGTVGLKGTAVKYADKSVKFTTTEFADLSKRTVDEHNVAYFYKEQIVGKDGKAAITDILSPTDLPTIDAYMKHLKGFSIKGANGNTITLTGEDAARTLESIKRQAFDEMIKADTSITYAELKARLNVSDGFLTGGKYSDEGHLWGATDFTQPSKAQITYGSGDRVRNIWEVKGVTFQDTRIRAMKEANARVAENILELTQPLPEVPITRFTGKDTFGGKILSANPDYNTAEEIATYVGGIIQRVSQKMTDSRSRAMLRADSVLQRTGVGSKAMAEIAAVRRLVTSSEEKLFLEEGNIVLKLNNDGVVTSEVVASVLEPEALQWLEAYHGYQKSLAIRKATAQRAVGGRGFDEEALYFQPPHPMDTKFRAFVSDKTGNLGMVYASTQKDLAEKIQLVQANHKDFTIFQEAHTDAYKKVQGEYDSLLSTRGKVTIDSAMHRSGTLSDMFPTTNPIDFTRQIHSGLARSEKDIIYKAINLRYGQSLAEAEQLAVTLNQPNGSYAKLYNVLTNSIDTTTPWAIFQGQVVRGVDHLVSMSWNTARGLLDKKMTIEQAEAREIAERFNPNGGANIFDSPQLWAMSGRKDFSGAAAKAIYETNHVMRTLQLGLDYINGLVQAAGFPILALPQIRAAMGNAGESGAHLKIMHQAIKDIMDAKSRTEILKRGIDGGVVSEDMYKYHDLLDSHANLVNATGSMDALRQSTTVKQKVGKLLDTLQTPTALAERYTALAAYRMGELSYMVGKEATLIDKVAMDAFAANFSRKVVGNYVAAQRPQIFQGILGSAVGLFQTYQGTYFQQAARFLEKPAGAKNLAMMGALQGTIFGAQSLPGFEAANYAVAGQWNDRREDFRTNLSGTPEVLGLGEVGDAMLYGAMSSSLGSALWTRGDVNPRLPMGGAPWNLENLAQFQYVKNILGAIGQWKDSVSNGGSLTMSTAEAIAHANLNRPLTGIMEFMTGVHTTKGGMLESAVSNDLLSVATAMRIAGTRPLHEVIATAETYKMGMVKAEEQKRLTSVAYALRSRLLSEPDDALDKEVISEFAKRYAEAGGNPKGFNKWFLANVGKASTPRAQQFADKIKNDPYAISYQQLAAPEGLDMLEAPSSAEVKAKLKELDSKAKQ